MGKLRHMHELALAKNIQKSACCISLRCNTRPSVTFQYRTIVFINRGWVDSKATEWNRPEGIVTMTTIISEVERVSNASTLHTHISNNLILKPNFSLLTWEQSNTFSPKNEPSTMKLFWVEDAALRSCAQLPDLKLNEVLVLEQYGECVSMSMFTTRPRLHFNS